MIGFLAKHLQPLKSHSTLLISGKFHQRLDAERASAGDNQGERLATPNCRGHKQDSTGSLLRGARRDRKVYSEINCPRGMTGIADTRVGCPPRGVPAPRGAAGPSLILLQCRDVRNTRPGVAAGAFDRIRGTGIAPGVLKTAQRVRLGFRRACRGRRSMPLTPCRDGGAHWRRSGPASGHREASGCRGPSTRPRSPVSIYRTARSR
jgi:hypothetical protein